MADHSQADGEISIGQPFQADATKPDTQVEREEFHYRVPPRFGESLGRYLNLVFTSLGAAAFIILLIVYFTPLAKSDPDADDLALKSKTTPLESAASSQPSQPAVVPPSRQPAVNLPSGPVPATAEQLHREVAQVAKDLQARFSDLPEALHVVAMMHAQLRQTVEAEKLWGRCIELSPKNEKYYVNLAAVAMDRGNSELAAKTLELAIVRGISSPDVFHHLAVAQMDLGKCEESLLTIDRALQTYPQFPAGWMVRGQAQLKLGQAAEAEASLQKALSLGSQSPEIYFALGNVAARQGKQQEAEAFHKRFTELKASQPLDTQQRFQILSTAEARRNAVAILSEAALVHSWQNDFLEAERLLLRAIALDPSNAACCRALATQYHNAGLKPEERVIRRRLVELEPRDFNHYVNLAKVSAELGELEATEAVLKLAISMQPERLDGYAVLAQLYQQSGKVKHARWFAQEAVRRKPTAEGYLFLATTCQQMGDQPGADAALEMARKLDPNHPQLASPQPGRSPESKPNPKRFESAYGNG